MPKPGFRVWQNVRVTRVRGFFKTRVSIPSADPYISGLLQGEHPEILAQFDPPGHPRVDLGHMEPPFWGGGEEVVGGQRWQHSKERWWFPIGSPLYVTVALSVTIRPQFGIECL